MDNLDITTQGGAGKGANDPDDVVSVSGSVLDHATPSFDSSLKRTALTIDFGIVEAGTGVKALPFYLANLSTTASFTAAMDLDAMGGSGAAAKLSTNLATFSALAAGASRAFLASFDTSTAGNFSAVYNLGCSDEDIPGANAPGSRVLTLNLQGRSLTAQWIQDGNGNWSTPANWVGAVPNGAGKPANFRTEISADTDVVLDMPQTVGSITLDSPFAYHITGTNALNVSKCRRRDNPRAPRKAGNFRTSRHAG